MMGALSVMGVYTLKVRKFHNINIIYLEGLVSYVHVSRTTKAMIHKVSTIGIHVLIVATSK